MLFLLGPENDLDLEPDVIASGVSERGNPLKYRAL